MSLLIPNAIGAPLCRLVFLSSIRHSSILLCAFVLSLAYAALCVLNSVAFHGKKGEDVRPRWEAVVCRREKRAKFVAVGEIQEVDVPALEGWAIV